MVESALQTPPRALVDSSTITNSSFRGCSRQIVTAVVRSLRLLGAALPVISTPALAGSKREQTESEADKRSISCKAHLVGVVAGKGPVVII